MDTTLPAFEAWMHQQGITWDTTRIKLVQDSPTLPKCSGLALAIVAITDTPTATHLCTIPKSACITRLTTSISDILEKEHLSGGLALVIAVMYESISATRSSTTPSPSPWQGYFTSMPRREYIPIFWTDEELAALQGTELDAGRVQEERDAIREDFQQHVLPLSEAYPDTIPSPSQGWTLDNFMNASSLVSSRAFGIDDDHGDGMVPLADVFNHKVSAVHGYLGDEYVVAGVEDDSDSDCDGSGSEEEEEDENNNNESKIPQAYGIKCANGLHLGLEITINDDSDSGDVLTIRAGSDIRKGNEIHNTYGELGNDTLVNKYGFALRQNPFTVVVAGPKKKVIPVIDNAVLQYGGKEEGETTTRTRKRQKTAQSSSTVSSSVIKKRKEAVKRVKAMLVAETELLDDEEEPFELLPNGHIGPSLYVYLTAMHLIVVDQEPTSIDDVLAHSNSKNGSTSAMQLWSVVDTNTGLLLPTPTHLVESSERNASLWLFIAHMVRHLVAWRRQRYPATASLQSTLDELRQVERAIQDEPVGTVLKASLVAARAALCLRATELELLRALIVAASACIDHHAVAHTVQ